MNLYGCITGQCEHSFKSVLDLILETVTNVSSHRTGKRMRCEPEVIYSTLCIKQTHCWMTGDRFPSEGKFKSSVTLLASPSPDLAVLLALEK